MNNRMRAWKWPAAYLTVMAMIALAASLGSRYLVGERCEMDGQALPATLRVDVKLANGTTHSFCSIECARRWLSAQKSSVKEAVVRDALTGEPLDAYVAFFVESPIVTNQRQRQPCTRLPRPHRCDGTHPPLRRPRDRRSFSDAVIEGN